VHHGFPVTGGETDASTDRRRRPGAAACAVQAAGFTLSSPTVKPGSTLTEAQVFKGFGCEGKNISPALKWSDAPSGTKSYAVTVYDPDAPTGSGWWHWVVYNIPASATELPEGAGGADGKGLPAGTSKGRTDFGARASAAPASPPATSRIATSSPCMRSRPTRSTCPRTPARPWSAS
jgi:phosphatidylethanolamine-binding protein (PEBP) family uncharacterized protein